jgi:hypothetical protein
MLGSGSCGMVVHRRSDIKSSKNRLPIYYGKTKIVLCSLKFIWEA